MTDTAPEFPQSYPGQDRYADSLYAIEFVDHDGYTARRLRVDEDNSTLCIPRIGERVETSGILPSSPGMHRVQDVVWASDLSWVRIIFEPPPVPGPLQQDQHS